MPACLHIGKALIIEILVKDAASLDYKERSSRRCIGKGCLDDLNFDKFCCRCGLVTRPREWGEAADRFQVEMSEMDLVKRSENCLRKINQTMKVWEIPF